MDGMIGRNREVLRMKVDKKSLICLMIDSGMNNKQLSDASGVSIARISNIRNGRNTTYETISKIAKVFGVKPEALFEIDWQE